MGESDRPQLLLTTPRCQTMDKIRLAAVLMLFSGLSHPSQLLIYDTDDPQMVTPALLGTLFLLLGAFLSTGKRAALWAGAIFAFLFGLNAAFRILTQDPNIMSYMLAAVDFVVVTLCVEALCMPARPAGGEVCYRSNGHMRSS